MSVPESQLREQYRNASDEDLMFLAQQGSSGYTDTAWALLQAEMTRRGLPPAPVQGSANADELPAEKAPVVLPLSRWGEVPDTGIREHAPPSADQRHQTYRLGRFFAALQVLWIFMHGNLFGQDFIPYLALYQVAWSALAGVAAAGQAAWRWHTLVTALAVHIGVRGFVLVDLVIAGELGVMDAAVFPIGMILDGLWFGYFYRRRALFDAARRWRWLERHVPILVGPDRYESTPLPLTSPVSQPSPTTFGTRVGAIFLAATIVAGALVLLLLVIFSSAKR